MVEPLAPGTFDRWVTRFRGPLVGLVASWRPSWREAEETAQDTFAEAWVARSRFVGDVEDDRAVGAWLRGIAFRLHQSKLRARRRLQLLGDDSLEAAGSDTDGDSDPLSRVDALRTAFGQLESGHQEILRMHYLESTTAKQVGALLGLTQKAVEQRLARARIALRNIGPATWTRRIDETIDARRSRQHRRDRRRRTA